LNEHPLRLKIEVDGHAGVDAQWLASLRGLVCEDCTEALIPGESGHLFLQLSSVVEPDSF
jgi:hypothetical protein